MFGDTIVMQTIIEMSILYSSNGKFKVYRTSVFYLSKRQQRFFTENPNCPVPRFLLKQSYNSGHFQNKGDLRNTAPVPQKRCSGA